MDYSRKNSDAKEQNSTLHNQRSNTRVIQRRGESGDPLLSGGRLCGRAVKRKGRDGSQEEFTHSVACRGATMEMFGQNICKKSQAQKMLPVSVHILRMLLKQARKEGVWGLGQIAQLVRVSS